MLPYFTQMMKPIICQVIWLSWVALFKQNDLSDVVFMSFFRLEQKQVGTLEHKCSKRRALKFVYLDLYLISFLLQIWMQRYKDRSLHTRKIHNYTIWVQLSSFFRCKHTYTVQAMFLVSFFLNFYIKAKFKLLVLLHIYFKGLAQQTLGIAKLCC